MVCHRHLRHGYHTRQRDARDRRHLFDDFRHGGHLRLPLQHSHHDDRFGHGQRCAGVAERECHNRDGERNRHHGNGHGGPGDSNAGPADPDSAPGDRHTGRRPAGNFAD